MIKRFSIFFYIYLNCYIKTKGDFNVFELILNKQINNNNRKFDKKIYSDTMDYIL